MTKLCEKCPVNEICLQVAQDKRCPIPTQPREKREHRVSKSTKRKA